MALYNHNNDKITEYPRLDMPTEKDIEEFIHRHPEVVEKDIMIVGRQVETGGMGIIDLLGIDSDGNVVVIEVKKGDALGGVVSQILRYAVWARDIGYDELNDAYDRLIKKHSGPGKAEDGTGRYRDLHAAMEAKFGVAPQPFNPGQRLYIVGEGIEQRIDDVCTYLRQNGVKIRCVGVEFFGDGDGDGKDIRKRIRVVRTDTVAEKQDGGAFNKWEYNMKQCDEETRNAINSVISFVEEKLGCTGEISEKGATYTFYAGGGREHGTRFAVVYAYSTKDYGNFDFLSDPEHDFGDDRVVGPPTYTFRDTGRAVYIVPENIDLITECAEHAYDAAMRAEAGNAAP